MFARVILLYIPKSLLIVAYQFIMSSTVTTQLLVTILLVLGTVLGQQHGKQGQRRNANRAYNNPSSVPITNHADAYGVSRHFAHFSGPVSGAEHQVVVPRGHAPLQGAHAHQYNQAALAQGTSVDFVAKPDYKFGYGVEDSKTGNKQTHEETREGDVVRGQYTLVEPDGSLRIVEYTADATHGFQAVVKRQGHAPEVFGAGAAHKQQQPKPQPQQSYQHQSQKYHAHQEEEDDDEDNDDGDEYHDYD